MREWYNYMPTWKSHFSEYLIWKLGRCTKVPNYQPAPISGNVINRILYLGPLRTISLTCGQMLYCRLKYIHFCCINNMPWAIYKSDKAYYYDCDISFLYILYSFSKCVVFAGNVLKYNWFALVRVWLSLSFSYDVFFESALIVFWSKKMQTFFFYFDEHYRSAYNLVSKTDWITKLLM